MNKRKALFAGIVMGISLSIANAASPVNDNISPAIAFGNPDGTVQVEVYDNVSGQDLKAITNKNGIACVPGADSIEVMNLGHDNDHRLIFSDGQNDFKIVNTKITEATSEIGCKSNGDSNNYITYAINGCFLRTVYGTDSQGIGEVAEALTHDTKGIALGSGYSTDMRNQDKYIPVEQLTKQQKLYAEAVLGVKDNSLEKYVDYMQNENGGKNSYLYYYTQVRDSRKNVTSITGISHYLSHNFTKTSNSIDDFSVSYHSSFSTLFKSLDEHLIAPFTKMFTSSKANAAEINKPYSFGPMNTSSNGLGEMTVTITVPKNNRMATPQQAYYMTQKAGQFLAKNAAIQEGKIAKNDIGIKAEVAPNTIRDNGNGTYTMEVVLSGIHTNLVQTQEQPIKVAYTDSLDKGIFSIITDTVKSAVNTIDDAVMGHAYASERENNLGVQSISERYIGTNGRGTVDMTITVPGNPKFANIPGQQVLMAMKSAQFLAKNKAISESIILPTDKGIVANVDLNNITNNGDGTFTMKVSLEGIPEKTQTIAMEQNGITDKILGAIQNAANTIDDAVMGHAYASERENNEVAQLRLNTVADDKELAIFGECAKLKTEDGILIAPIEQSNNWHEGNNIRAAILTHVGILTQEESMSLMNYNPELKTNTIPLLSEESTNILLNLKKENRAITELSKTELKILKKDFQEAIKTINKEEAKTQTFNIKTEPVETHYQEPQTHIITKEEKIKQTITNLAEDYAYQCANSGKRLNAKDINNTVANIMNEYKLTNDEKQNLFPVLAKKFAKTYTDECIRITENRKQQKHPQPIKKQTEENSL